jgi:hypothetical protein
LDIFQSLFGVRIIIVDSPAMDEERFQQMEKRLNEQAEAT